MFAVFESFQNYLKNEFFDSICGAVTGLTHNLSSKIMSIKMPKKIQSELTVPYIMNTIIYGWILF